MAGFVYRILLESEWRAMLADGLFHGGELDRRDGFIHLSSGAQVAGTLSAYFTGRSDVVVLEIDAECIAPELRYEPSRNGELFPHLYGSLPLAAVVRVVEDAQPGESVTCRARSP